MCGLFSILSRGNPIELKALLAGALELEHRGPDEGDVWLSPNRTIGIAHKRLSIVDLFTGKQPLTNEDNSITAAVNGEFYGFEAIRRNLKQHGHEFSTHSDSEILVHLYEQYGVDCVTHLRGEYAFVLWDSNRDRLFAARDRFGIKPLCFSEHNGDLYLASEAKALFAAGVPCRWDRRGYVQHLYGIPSEDQTYFEGVHQIRPGHFLLATPAAAASQTKYWDFDYPPTDAAKEISDAEAIERGREILCEAVRIRLQGDVPVGMYLSGGIDSSGIIGIAAKQFDCTLEAFTVAWDDEEANEASLARETARMVGANFHVCQVSEDILADCLPDAVWHCESPATLSAAAKFRLSRLAREHGMKVVLTGEGADDVYAGYPPFRIDFKGRTRRRAAPYLQDLATALGFSPMWINPDPILKLIDRNAIACPPSFDPIAKFLSETDVAGRLKGRHPLNVSVYLWSKIKLLHFFLVQVADRTEMGHSIEGRTPYLDQKLVEFGCRLPPSLKIREGQEKFILRECVKPYVTDTIYRRKKQHFINPLQTLAPGGRLRQLYEDTFNSSAAENLPFFETPKLRALITECLADQRRSGDAFARVADVMLQSLLGLCLMQERFNPS